jgi:N-methylhydantoinase A
VLAGYGADPRDLAMIAYGGNGGVHAWAVADELGIDTVLVPRSAPVFSAVGLLVADHRVDLQRSHTQPLSTVDPQQLQKLLDELTDDAFEELAPTGLASVSISVQPYVQMSYAGQNFDMSVPPPAVPLDDASLLDLTGAFHDLHEADRGFAFRNQEPVVRGVRVVATGSTPKPGRLAEPGGGASREAARTGQRDARFGDGYVSAPTYDGERLGCGSLVAGPALIEERFTVVVVPPGWSAEVTDHSSVRLQRD